MLLERQQRWAGGASSAAGRSKAAALLKARTLSNLYNERPSWLDHAHRVLDTAVTTACGWPHDITEDSALVRLLALDLERATTGRCGVPVCWRTSRARIDHKISVQRIGAGSRRSDIEDFEAGADDLVEGTRDMRQFAAGLTLAAGSSYH